MNIDKCKRNAEVKTEVDNKSEKNKDANKSKSPKRRCPFEWHKTAETIEIMNDNWKEMHSNNNNNPEPTHRCFGEDYILFKRPKNQNLFDYSSNVSDEILLHIFKLLPRSSIAYCAQVCKRWRLVANDESLWRKIDLKKKHLLEGMLGYIVNKNPTVLRLASTKIDSPIFTTGYENQIITRLQYLDMSMANITEQSLAKILSACVNLRKLSLEHCQLNNEIASCIARNRELEVLNLTMTGGLTENGLCEIITLCEKLVELNLAWSNICSTSYELLAQLLPTGLKQLNISGARDKLKNSHIAMIGEKCPNLIELDLSDGHGLTGEVMEIIASKMTKIEHLHLNYCYHIQVSKYVNITKLKYLKSLQVNGIFDDDALVIVRGMLPNIEINTKIFSTIARPTSSHTREAIVWGIQLK